MALEDGKAKPIVLAFGKAFMLHHDMVDGQARMLKTECIRLTSYSLLLL
jgi:hypothetical protein